MQAKKEKGNQTIEPMTKIGNVVLTNAALERLGNWQEEDNYGIDEDIKLLVNVILFISRNFANIYESEHKEGMSLINEMSMLAKIFEDFKKP